MESSNSFPEQARKLRMTDELLNPLASFCFWIGADCTGWRLYRLCRW